MKAASKGKRTRRKKLVEVFAGSAGVSAAAERKEGWTAIAINWHGNRHTPKVPILKLNLLEPGGKAALFDVLRDPEVEHVHFATPCGTNSRAREKRLRRERASRFTPDPPQLRSEQCVRGFPACEVPSCRGDRDGCTGRLHGADIIKVQRGNALADLTIEAVNFLALERPEVTWTTDQHHHQ